MKFSIEQFLELRAARLEGQNLTELITKWGIPIDFEVISLIYEMQAGTYTTYANENPEFTERFAKEISETLSKYISKESTILDCGTGESNIFIPILKNLGIKSGVGIDASISRLTWAKNNAVSSGLDLKLAAADFGRLPLPDKSVDAVLTVHALEPNGGRECDLIRELGRVARKYIFLVEPDFENASSQQKLRMDKLNFVRNLDGAIAQSGFSISEKVPVNNNSRVLNSASITVVEISQSDPIKSVGLDWVDPIFRQPLIEFENGLYNGMGLWYPIIRGIPLLCDSDAKYLYSPTPKFF